MKRVKIAQTGEQFTALSNVELVEKLRFSSFNPGKSIHDFMKDYARRAVISEDIDIRATDIDSFVEDLFKHKHLEVIPNIPEMN